MMRTSTTHPHPAPDGARGRTPCPLPATEPRRRPWRVVVADDSPEDRAEVRRQLLRGSDRRYEIVEAVNAKDAVRAVLDAPAGPPDCLVLDYHMPDGDALEVLEALVGPDGGCVCPVVVLTGGDERTTGCSVLRAGAQDFLGKAWMSPQSVTRAVENAAERHLMAQELRQSQRELRDADRRKDEFLATLAHELRNPLAPIRTGLEILRRGGAPDELAARTQDVMERQLSHLVRLVDDLLDVSRISRGMVELRPERIELRTIVEHAVETSRPLVEVGRHTLVIEVPQAPVWVSGDLTRLAQVVSNLLNNSAKYTPSGGRIELTAGVEDGAAGSMPFVRVSDDGIGIAPEMLPRVFDLFAQVDRTLDRSKGGLGIGLSLVRRLVEMHGGTIDAKSRGIGQGSSFTVRLPLASATAEASLRTPRPCEPTRAPRAGRRVLVVDDNLDAAETMAMLLELAGHEAITAASGPAALESARAWQPELVFLDIGLPGMDGNEVARRLRADPRTSQMVLVALTGWGSDEDKRRSKDAGFDLHLVKPVGPEVVADVLAGLPVLGGAVGASVGERE
jgi:signal transduction histidine kinase